MMQFPVFLFRTRTSDKHERRGISKHLFQRQDDALPQPATRAPIGKAAVTKQIADKRLFPGNEAARLPHERGRFGLA